MTTSSKRSNKNRSLIWIVPVTTLLLLLLLPLYGSAMSSSKTYYKILEIKQGDQTTIKDIKKAYRRLALKHHPDRNGGDEEAAAVRFREINEAYEVLSDVDQRAHYDRSLRSGGGGGGGGGGGDGGFSHADFRRQRGERHQHRDPFAQFNDLFKNDPFFAEAMKGMDDLFESTFQGHTADRSSGGGNEGVGWGTWLLNKAGVNVQFSSTTTTASGTHSTTSSYSGGRRRDGGGGRARGGSGGFVSRSTRTVIENGERITVQSLQKDGNKIEEKYKGDVLVERTINGEKENIEIKRVSNRREF